MSENTDPILTHLILKHGSLDNVHQLWLTNKIDLSAEEEDVILNWISDLTGADVELRDNGGRHIIIDFPL